jgi:hypothetical protein
MFGGKMKYEYHEGPKAAEAFERLARSVFRIPKLVGGVWLFRHVLK